MCSNAPEKCSPEFTHEVIYSGLEYAHPRVDHVPFGKDGKPLFFTGPYDDEHKISFVINTLNRTCGEGNYHYIEGWAGNPD
jgi:hypothetical protein